MRDDCVPAWESSELVAGESTLPAEFFARSTRLVAEGLLGATILSRAGGVICGGRIVETEAYLGQDDPGSHAATKGMTTRNRVMYGPPGTAYVYLSYGMHFMLNLVTEVDGVAGAVLVRAFQPVFGIETMRLRRAGMADTMLANGPGKVAAALGVTGRDNGTQLGSGTLAVFGATDDIEATVTGRIGLSKGYDLPLRFLIKDDPWVSRSHSCAVRRGGTRA